MAEEKARLTGARAAVTLAELELDRLQRLFKTGSTNKARLDTAQAAYDTAQSNLAVIEQTIIQKTIRAPFSGVTKPGNLQVGQYLNIGEDVAEITDRRDSVWVDFRLPQFLGILEVGSNISVVLNPWESVEGQLISRDENITVDLLTRLYRALVSDEQPELSNGSFVEVDVPAQSALTVVDLPVTALQSDAYGQFVYVLAPAETEGAFRAARRDVSEIHYQGDRVLIGEGLEQGALIATDGSFKLYTGILTYVVDDLPDETASDSGW